MNTKDILKKYRITTSTLSNWRRGYYWVASKSKNFKRWYLSDHSTLKCRLVKIGNTKLERWEYSEQDVSDWENKINGK